MRFLTSHLCHLLFCSALLAACLPKTGEQRDEPRPQIQNSSKPPDQVKRRTPGPEFFKKDFTKENNEEPQTLDLSGIKLPETPLQLAAETASPESTAELTWRSIRAYGQGDDTPCFYRDSDPRNTLSPIWANSELSFLFASMAIDLSPPSIALAQRDDCTIDAKVTLPVRSYIQSVAQTVILGGIASSGSQGTFALNSFLFNEIIRLKEIPHAIGPAPESYALAEKKAEDHLSPLVIFAQCLVTSQREFTTRFRFAFKMRGQRPDTSAHLALHLDSLDVRYGVAFTVRRCPLYLFPQSK